MFLFLFALTVLFTQSGCSTPDVSQGYVPLQDTRVAMPLPGIFSGSTGPTAVTPTLPPRPPREVASVPTHQAEPPRTAWRPAAPIQLRPVQECVDGSCALPPPASGSTDAFGSVPTGFERPIGIFVPSTGNVTLHDVGDTAIFGRLWGSNMEMRGLGIGVGRPLGRGWHGTTEIGVAPGSQEEGNVGVAAGLSRRF